MSSHMPRRQANLETNGKLYIRLISNKHPICSQYSGTDDFGNISQLGVGSDQSEKTKGNFVAPLCLNIHHKVLIKSNVIIARTKKIK